LPSSSFGIVLGLAGLGNCWRVAHRVWQLPEWVGESLLAAATLTWAVLVVVHARQWLTRRAEAAAELKHPIQGCYVALWGVSTLLVAGGLFPYSRPLAEILFVLGFIFTLGFAVYRSGNLWLGSRELSAATPALYLPLGASFFVTATVASAFGYADWGQLAFGAGFFSCLAIESVLLNRLHHAPPLGAPLRPSLGIQMAPAAVGAVAYVSVAQGPPGWLAQALIGYGLLQTLVLLRLLPWVQEQAFTPSYWAFSFGASSLATAPLRLIEQGDRGPLLTLAPVLFLAANLVIGLLSAKTLMRLLQRRLFSPTQAPAAPRAHPADSHSL
jgi:tellurite resistance protein